MQGLIKRSICSLFCMLMLVLSLPVLCAKAAARTVSTKEELASALYERVSVIEVKAQDVDGMIADVLCAYPLLGFDFKGYEGAIYGDTISMTMDYRNDEMLPVLSVDSIAAFEETVTQAAIACSEEVHILMPTTMRDTDFGSVFNQVFSNSVLARTMLSSFNWEIWNNSYTNVLYMSLTIKYSVAHDELIRYKQRAEEEAVRLAQSLYYQGAEDAVLALLAHDALINRCEYSAVGYLHAENHSAYGALCNRSAVCEGYAEAYQLLMDIAGIECIYVAGEANEPHAWNMLCIDGSYYHVDTTWDDPLSTDAVQRLLHDYFLISDTQMSQTHTWERSSYPVAHAAVWSAEKAKEQLAQNGSGNQFAVHYTTNCDADSLRAYEKQLADLLAQQQPSVVPVQTTTESDTTQSTTDTELTSSSTDTTEETVQTKVQPQSQTTSTAEKTTSITTASTAAMQHQGVSKGALYLVWGILIVFGLGILYAKFIH